MFKSKSLTLMLGLLLSANVTALEIQETNGIRWVTGGIGKEERAALAEYSSQFNVKLLFASTEGHFFGKADVIFGDAAGNEVLAAKANGPYLYAALPAGDYSISATNRGKEKQQSVSAPESGQAERRFIWKYEDPKAEIVEKERSGAAYEVIVIQGGEIQDVRQADSYEELKRIEQEIEAGNATSAEMQGTESQ